MLLLFKNDAKQKDNIWVDIAQKMNKIVLFFIIVNRNLNLGNAEIREMLK